MPETIVFIHGWSVTHTDTYGGLPERLAVEAAAAGQKLDVRNLWLSRYVSFRDEVRMEDLSLAMEHAVRRELSDLLARGERFGVITHSTGGPVARDWWWRHYVSRKDGGACPMSHLVMLAPANFGSALAQLGKSRVSRLKSWLGGEEPGQGVLDWLEHGSLDAWELNEAWIRGRFGQWEEANVFPFVLTGQTIDRKLYDHLNSYTGELGSDGVVRVPAANMNARLVRLVQKRPDAQGKTDQTGELEMRGRVTRGPATAFRLISGASHSGKDKGILNSVAPEVGGRGTEVVEAVRRCLAVQSAAGYTDLATAFDAETDDVRRNERAEIEKVPILPDREYIHDRTSLVIFRVHDSEGHPLADFDLEIRGPNDNPDLLPEGFFKDRQKNQRARHVLTYFLNYDLLVGTPEVPDPRDDKNPLREEQPGIEEIGLHVTPRPQEGFVHFLPCGIRATARMMGAVLAPDETTLVDIELHRIVHEGVFRMSRATEGRRSFKKDPPGPALGETE